MVILNLEQTKNATKTSFNDEACKYKTNDGRFKLFFLNRDQMCILTLVQLTIRVIYSYLYYVIYSYLYYNFIFQTTKYIIFIKAYLFVYVFYNSINKSLLCIITITYTIKSTLYTIFTYNIKNPYEN